MRNFMLVAFCLVLAQGVAMAADVIINPHISTDRAVDAATVGTMVDSLVKPGMTDQDKALAIYNFVRRTMFHYRYYTQYGGGGATNLINGTGYCLCTPTAGAECELLEAAGIKARILSTPGHGSVTVFFDGKWHWLDAFLGGCLTGKDGKTLVDLADVVADPSLLKGDHALPVPLFPCRDLLYADAIRWEPDNKKYHQDCGPDDFAWTNRATPGKKEPTGWASTMTLDITLRPGEMYNRNWDGVPGMYFLHKTQDRLAPPHHFCGIEAEQRDPANWPYFKPYVKEITSYDPKLDKNVTVKTGRYWANGALSWVLDLSSSDTIKQFSRAENVQLKGGAVVQTDPAKPGVFELTVNCPYMLQGGSVTFDWPGVDKVKVTMAVAPALNDKPPASQPEATFLPLDLTRSEQKVSQFSEPYASADLRPSFERQMGTRSYKLRFELADGAAVKNLQLLTDFQHNMYALPQLMPGKNQIKIAVANPEALKAGKFCVEFLWDGPDGKSQKERRVVDKSPYTFMIETPGGPDLPRMRSLLLSNDR